MFKPPTTLSSSELADDYSSKLTWHLPVAPELAPDQALEQGLITADEAQSMNSARAAACIGHNNPSGDPGPDLKFRIALNIPEYVSRETVMAFERALQEQGDHEHRLAALDQAAYRARADKRISAAAYRVYEVLRVASKGKHRCCLSDLDKVGFFAAVDRTRASRLLGELEENGLAVILKFTEGQLGAPSARKLFIAPVVTAEDRMEASTARLQVEAEMAKVAELRKRADAAKKAYHRDVETPLVVTEATRKSSCAGDNERGFLVAKTAVSSCAGDNTLKHNRNSREKDMGAHAPSPAHAGFLPLEKAPTQNGTGSAASSPSSQRPPTVVAGEITGSTGSAGRWVPPSPAEISAGFDEWWQHYPKKVDKLDARKAYAARVTDKNPESRATIPQLLAALKAYKFGEFIKHPATWLNKGSWADVIPHSKPANGEALLLAPETARQLLQLYPAKRLQDWRRDILGPPPNEPGCRFSPDIIRELGFSVTGASS